MAVVDTERTTRMTSCSVHIACDKKDPNFYDLALPWDVRITNSGTFLHYSTGDPTPDTATGRTAASTSRETTPSGSTTSPSRATR